MGVPHQGTRTYSARLFANSKISNVKSQIAANKHKAFTWYSRWASFKKVQPSQTYAQALMKNSDQKLVTLAGHNASFVAKAKKHVRQKYNATHAMWEGVTTRKPKFVQCAGNAIPSRKTKNVPNLSNK